jgi:hypothetical protein
MTSVIVYPYIVPDMDWLGTRVGAGGVSRAAYRSHASGASRSGVVIASSSGRPAADEGPGLGQRPVADRVARPHAGGRGDGPRAAGAGTGRRHRAREAQKSGL